MSKAGPVNQPEDRGSVAQPEPQKPQAADFCPRCSQRLKSRSCKMICAGCGYYMSCSDFY